MFPSAILRQYDYNFSENICRMINKYNKPSLSLSLIKLKGHLNSGSQTGRPGPQDDKII